MTWFYKVEDQEKGPFSKDELQNLINDKKINAQTLVRKEHESGYRPLKELARSKSKTDPQQSSEKAKEQVAQAAEGTTEKPGDDKSEQADTKICSQCGRPFPEDQVVTFDDKIICSNCKPAFVQRVKEGAEISSILKYAGFWVRLGAKIIDWLILVFLQWLFIIPLSAVIGFSGSMQNPEEMVNNPTFYLYIGIMWLIQITIPAVYTTFFLGRYAATVGKMACGLRVVAPDSGKISYLRALGRHFAEMLSGLIILIGYIMAAFDDEKRALHDRICSTRVVHKK